MSRNSGQQVSTEGDGVGKVEQLHAITKLYFMIFGGLNFIAVMWLAWKVYDPEMWFPTFPSSTFVVLEIALFVFWVLQMQRIETFTGKKDDPKSRPTPPR